MVAKPLARGLEWWIVDEYYSKRIRKYERYNICGSLIYSRCFGPIFNLQPFSKSEGIFKIREIGRIDEKSANLAESVKLANPAKLVQLTKSNK